MAMPEEEKDVESPLREKPKETSGQYLWRVLKPVGCIAVLILFISYLVFCFTYKSDPALAPVPPAAAQQTQTAN